MNMLEDLVEKMDQYASLEYGASFRVITTYHDRSVEVEVNQDVKDPWDRFRIVLADAGVFNNHWMVEIREEPSIIINAIPKMIVACILEI